MRYLLIIIGLVFFLYGTGCKRKYSKLPRDLTIFERITRERTDDEVMEDFIDSLLLRMSLAEKIGQMTQLSESMFYEEADPSAATPATPSFDSAAFLSAIKEFQIGSVLLSGARTARQWYAFDLMLQQINMSGSKNRIPLVLAIDHVHGTGFLYGGTIFPHQINMGATFNTELVRQAGQYTSQEAAHLGQHWDFAPVLDIGENKQWPRLYETFGEDTWLVTKMGSAYIDGLQNGRTGPYRMAACAKNFIGYSIPTSGWDRTPAEISGQRLQEVFVPPYKMAIDSGLMTVMISSAELNGIPIHSSYYHLTTLLRDQLQFHGVAITDYEDIIKLHRNHRITANEKESTFTAVMAGVDMAMTPNTTDFCRYLRELVREDRIPEERIDLSVRRILRLKYRLGLFDRPFPSEAYYDRIGTEAAHQAARNTAAESVVLMKNTNNLLPLSRPARLVVAGRNADSRMGLCGGWTYTWQGNDETVYPDSMMTFVDALEEEFEDTRIILTNRNGISWHARMADALIIVTGESPYTAGQGNIDGLRLPQEELDLIETAVATGKPVILILLEGRPRVIGERFEECHAVIFAGLPGMFGGETLAGILKGRINPSGKMPVTYPYHTGLAIPYNHKHTVTTSLAPWLEAGNAWTMGEFGTGLSYTTFEYTDLQLSDTVLAMNEKLEARLTVKNTGQREGKEAVLWFLKDEVGTVTRPVRQLKHFEKKFLLPGEMKEYTFLIDPYKHLGFPDETGSLNLEPGYYTLSAGPLNARFRLIE